MWTFHHPPTAMLERLYHFTPTAEWLDEVRLASVRFPGGTGSFVSPTGLVLTNHHVALDTLQKLSSQEKDYVKDGFYAKETNNEVKTVDLNLDVMVSMEEVTDRVNGAVKPGASPQDALKQCDEAAKAIEKESQEKTKLKSAVYSLYSGASTGSIATRPTTIADWSSRRSNRSRSTAAIPTTSPIRATTSISQSSACTRTTSPPRLPTSSVSIPTACATETWCSSRGTRGAPSAS